MAGVRGAACAVAAVALGASGFLLGLSPAGAADSGQGSLIVLPSSGTLDTPMDVITSGLCTRGVTFIVALRGKGIDPATAGNLVGNTALNALGVPQYPGHYAVPVSFTLRQFMANNGVSLAKGNYDVVFSCRNIMDAEDLQTFSGTLAITPKGYRAVGVAATPVASFAGDPAPTASAATESSDPGEGGDAADAPAVTPVAQTDPMDTWRPLLVVGGLLLVAGAAFAWWRQRGRAS